MAEPFTFDRFVHPDRFGEYLGYKVTMFDRDKREGRVAMTVGAEHTSMSGKAHGGVVAALLDFACGVAAATTMSKADITSTVELKVNYLKPVEKNDTIEAVAKVAFRGKKLCVISAFLYRGTEEEPLAMASATYNVVEAKK
jgi:uncharacterized protein (TIGR00369 family)